MSKLAVYRVKLGTDWLHELANMVDVSEDTVTAIHISPEQHEIMTGIHNKPLELFRGIPLKVSMLGVDDAE